MRIVVFPNLIRKLRLQDIDRIKTNIPLKIPGVLSKTWYFKGINKLSTALRLPVKQVNIKKTIKILDKMLINLVH